MGRLGEADRNAVVLRYFENKSAQEVAAKLNVTEAAAHNSEDRAVERLGNFSRNAASALLTTTLLAGAVAANCRAGRARGAGVHSRGDCGCKEP